VTSFCHVFPPSYCLNFLFIPRLQRDTPIFSSFILRTEVLSRIQYIPVQSTIPERVSCNTDTSSLYSGCAQLSSLKFLIVFLSNLRKILEYCLLLGCEPLLPLFSIFLFSYYAANQADTDSIIELNTDY
jgi:hypothetical protein